MPKRERSSTEEILDECFLILSQIEATKLLYKDLDALIAQLRDLGFEEGRTSNGIFRLVDNFKQTNTVFRPAGVRRFELKMEKKT